MPGTTNSGRRPTPIPILKARGSWRADARDSAAELRVPTEVPDCPDWLSDDGKTEWARVAPQLERLGVVALVDQVTLGMYCEAVAEFIKAVMLLKGTSPILVRAGAQGGDVYYQNPLIAIRNGAFQRALQVADRFGFCPTARVRLKEMGESIEGKEPQGKSRFFSAG